MKNRNIYRDILFGVAVGDALGVPVEFRSRDELRRDPVIDMRGYGTHNQPPGTWSDDSSLTFCTAEVLAEGYDINAIGQSFVRWHNKGYWSAHGEVFDIGGITLRGIARLAAGTSPDQSGDEGEWSNGNGSLMRILPLLFLTADKPAAERYRITKEVSSITHRHVRSVTACFICLELARYLKTGMDKFRAYKSVQVVTSGHLRSLNISNEERTVFDRLMKSNIWALPEEEIKTGGYVVDTLEAAIWCVMTTDSYREAVLRAVNLGKDTDTTASVTGGLAGLLYGYETIPAEWVKVLARRRDIEKLAARCERGLKGKGMRDEG